MTITHEKWGEVDGVEVIFQDSTWVKNGAWYLCTRGWREKMVELSLSELWEQWKEENKLLADVAGVETIRSPSGTLMVPSTTGLGVEINGKYYTPWTPLTDHNQMALVKAALKEKGFSFTIKLWATSGEYTMELDDNAGHIYCAGHKDELMAIGLAVAKMCNTGAAQ